MRFIKKPETCLNYSSTEILFTEHIHRITLRDVPYTSSNASTDTQMMPSVVFQVGANLKEVIWVCKNKEDTYKIISEVISP